ncbi:MAG: GatB/YqeY domain-containing protein, partial [Raoultibacter sp.]
CGKKRKSRAACGGIEAGMNYTELHEEIKTAMRAHDKIRLSILRQVHGEIKNIEVNERRDVTDQDVDDMLKRTIKQTRETLEGSIKAGNNQERTDLLTEQVALLEGYLPQQVSGDALVALIDQVVAETGAATKKDMGRVMGALTKATGGNFDKAAAAKEVGARLV